MSVLYICQFAETNCYEFDNCCHKERKKNRINNRYKREKNAVIDKSNRSVMCKEKLDARHMSVINLTKIQIYKIVQCSVSSNKYPSIIIFLDVRKKTFK